VRHGHSRRRMTKSDRELTYGVLFVTGIALLIAVMLLFTVSL
jgi:hypothetical protein